MHSVFTNPFCHRRDMREIIVAIFRRVPDLQPDTVEPVAIKDRENVRLAEGITINDSPFLEFRRVGNVRSIQKITRMPFQL